MWIRKDFHGTRTCAMVVWRNRTFGMILTGSTFLFVVACVWDIVQSKRASGQQQSMGFVCIIQAFTLYNTVKNIWKRFILRCVLLDGVMLLLMDKIFIILDRCLLNNPRCMNYNDVFTGFNENVWQSYNHFGQLLHSISSLFVGQWTASSSRHILSAWSRSRMHSFIVMSIRCRTKSVIGRSETIV